MGFNEQKTSFVAIKKILFKSFKQKITDIEV